jgi:predicted ATPase/DNA-binding SARP family transcriptional activator
MSVEFRVLGSVGAEVGGQRLDIGHARQRCILAALLVDVNKPIPLQQMISRVWSDEPPSSIRKSLASYMSRLRALFADVVGVQISRRPEGYVLEADALSVDLHRFRSEVRAARATADPAQATVLFDRALDIWDGEPFASLDTAWINDMRDALATERHSVAMDRNDVALRAGRHAELMAELTAAVAANPLDERLAGQLMLAQYRTGRQADALGTYQRMREQLVEELGVDPGHALQAVHQQILAGDPKVPVARKAPEVPEVSAGSPTTREQVFDRSHPGLLRRATRFVNHEKEMAKIVTALGEGPLVTLTGVGGVGKSRLAFEIARREEKGFDEGVRICELAPLAHGEAVGHTVASAVGLLKQHSSDVTESVIAYLRSRELLLVVDNCEHLVEAASELIELIVAHCAGVSVLATSRQPLGIDGERIVVIPPLPVSDASLLFADRARASRPDFNLGDQPAGAVAEICRRVDCLPLGIELAAARMRVMSTPDMVRRLDQMHLVRGGARGALPRQQSLTATIDWSYRLLTSTEQALFIRLCVFAGSFDLEAAHCVCAPDAASEAETLELLAGLVDKSMVVVRNVTDRTRYGVLETLRAFGRQRLHEQGNHDAYTMRHAVYFCGLAKRAAVGLQGADEQDWVERMLPEYDNLRAAFEQAMANGDTDLALGLVTSLAELLGLRVGHELAAWAERVVAIADRDHPLFAAAVGAAAGGAWIHGDFSKTRSLAALAEGLVPGRGSARSLYPGDVLLDAALFEGNVPDNALAYWDGEVARARENADPIRLVSAATMSATYRGFLVGREAALAAALQAVEVADKTGNPTARSMAYFTLGYLLKKSEPDRALVLFDDAARLAGAVRNRWWYGFALLEAAATRAVHGDPLAAARLFIEVLNHWDRVGDATQLWVSLRYITRLLVRLGADDDALALHCAIVKAGKPAPLREAQLGALIDRLGTDPSDALLAAATGGCAAATVRARSSLQCHVQPAGEPAPSAEGAHGGSGGSAGPSGR